LNREKFVATNWSLYPSYARVIVFLQRVIVFVQVSSYACTIVFLQVTSYARVLIVFV